ncbi:transposase InsO family protein [Bradyrhizobium japonicum]|nr:transposase InsO family protein [Bradyrhizobium japonicum]MCP1862568.1 transposase InsO family protein [Bradyrhizobium japonicum]MCP1893423.1 transposase InsO family protein [Bradyrhizobium japonicum]MCW2326534.1 transposase InsO family protein [Bradyrhizobium japonicum]
MIDRGHDLSIVRQAKVLKLARSTVYYEPRPVSAEDLALMRRLDELHLDYPFAGARMLRSLLRREGVYAGRRHIATLMKRMGIEAVYRRPNTSKPAPGHKIYPYLLRGLKIERPDHAWAMDITYIPMRRGFVYLAAVVDVFSRRVLAHRVSITMEAAFCVEAVQEALAKHGRPEIFNTDQGSQFTSLEFTDVLLDAKIAISMDGKGAWRDNVFVERLWRTVKYEEVYLRAYDSVSEARASIAKYLACHSACNIDPRIASPRMLLDNFSPMIGSVPSNWFGGVYGGKDQHGRAARGGVGGNGALPIGQTSGEGTDPRRAVRDDWLASQACGARAQATRGGWTGRGRGNKKAKTQIWRDDQGRADCAVGGVGSGVRQAAQGDDPDLAACP